MDPLFFIVIDIIFTSTADDRTGKREFRRYSLPGEGGREFPYEDDTRIRRTVVKVLSKQRRRR